MTVTDATVSIDTNVPVEDAGLVAGAYPAARAARMEPVDALRAGT